MVVSLQRLVLLWCFALELLSSGTASQRRAFLLRLLAGRNYHLSYTAQAIAAGDFVVMPVYAEEMYDPDVFGKGVVGMLKVGR